MGNWTQNYRAGRLVIGHDHFWSRALSRRQFLGTSTGGAAALATSPLWMPRLAEAAGADPVPIPGGFAPGIHAFLGPGTEPSTIYDFRGVTGVATVRGTGTAWNTATGEKTALLFDSDNRFMQGQYVGADGRRRRGTFGFV